MIQSFLVFLYVSGIIMSYPGVFLCCLNLPLGFAHDTKNEGVNDNHQYHLS